MDIAQFEQLNTVYEPLSRRAALLCKALNETGSSAQWQWYANHSVFLEGNYRTESFPIPVITVKGVCDIGLHLNELWMEFQLPRERALTFDWSCLAAPFEVYGVEDYLHDFYREGMEAERIAGRIEASGEQAVNVACTFPWDTPDEELLRVVSQCLGWAAGQTRS